ncbi:hypothetical protein L2E82_27464 [Cichorium intybus]|uniref:Uncharacterized protein n=1 Tax=Cichorium intybus TaxID=13427 RepID=A0ACB9CT65_CICIN|nr:hypothetical protein L2E82_27464 [Cichorium intybus]
MTGDKESLDSRRKSASLTIVGQKKSCFAIVHFHTFQLHDYAGSRILTPRINFPSPSQNPIPPPPISPVLFYLLKIRIILSRKSSK